MSYQDLFGDARTVYDFEIFENHMVKVQPTGQCIRVGIKDDEGREFSWPEPRYPFHPRPASLVIPPQNGWDMEIEAPTPEVQRYIFTKGDRRHVLTLTVTDPSKKPMPVTVEWE